MAFLPVSPTTTSFVGKNIHMQNAMSFTREVLAITVLTAQAPLTFHLSKPLNKNFCRQYWRWNAVLRFVEGDEVNYGLNTTGFAADYGEIGSTHTSVFFGGRKETSCLQLLWKEHLRRRQKQTLLCWDFQLWLVE